MSAPHVPGPAGPAWSRWLGRAVARGFWNTKVVGRERVPSTGPVLLAANHSGIADGPILIGVAPRPLHILVKKEMFSGPIGVLMRTAGQIPVDRTSGGPALTAALGVLQRGGAVGVFPEGNRGRGTASSARAGVAWLAVRGGAPVVPVAVLGTRRTGETVGHIPGFRRKLYLEFGEPVHVEQMDGGSRREATTAAIETIRTALSDLVADAAVRTGLELPTD